MKFRKEGVIIPLVVKAACTLALALALIGSGVAYSRTQAHPTTLAWANGQIAAFAQDGDQISWATSVTTPKPGTCAWQVRIRLLSKHQQKLLNLASGPTCHSDSGFDISHPTYLALAGRRALWTMQESGNSFYQQLVTESYSARPDVRLEELVFANNLGEGAHLGGIAGDASTLVYGFVNVTVSGPPDCDLNGTCTAAVSGGGVKRVIGAHTVTVPGAPPPLMLAASGNRIALVVAESASTSGTVGPGSPAGVVVLNAATGAGVGSFTPLGQPQAIAFSISAVGVLVSTPGGKRIEFHSPAGALIRSISVPTGATGLSMSGTKAVFRVGKSIRIVPIGTGAVRQIAFTAATPIGLSIEGKRIAWAENVTDHHAQRGRVRAVTVR
jgi:hypothetical protein